MANVFRTSKTSVAYVTSVTKPLRGTRGRMRMMGRRIRSEVSVRLKGDGTPPGSILLGSVSGFFIYEDRYIVTNFMSWREPTIWHWNWNSVTHTKSSLFRTL